MQWLKDIKLAVKLTGAFVVLAIVVGVVGMLGRSATQDLSGRVKFLKENIVTAIIELGNVELQLQLYRGSAWKTAAVEDEKVRSEAWQQAQNALTAAQEAFARYEPTATFPGEKKGFSWSAKRCPS